MRLLLGRRGGGRVCDTRPGEARAAAARRAARRRTGSLLQPVVQGSFCTVGQETVGLTTVKNSGPLRNLYALDQTTRQEVALGRQHQYVELHRRLFVQVYPGAPARIYDPGGMSEQEQANSVAASFSALETRRTRSTTSRDRPSLRGGAKAVPAAHHRAAKGGGTRVGQKVGAPA